VVYEGRAYALGAEPLLVGRAPQGARTLELHGPLAGVSRTHCRLMASAAEAVLEDLSTHGTFLNGGRVQHRARLAAGDRIRVGTPGIELGLLRLAG
jgi:pSer/pThr/pTyr-binding forkhead associated (FHA) protein